MKERVFHDRLKELIHEYILLTYRLTKNYPTSEQFGLISQDRRAAVSVMLNYIEGYERMRKKVTVNFYETAFASLKESIYTKYLAKDLEYITQEEYTQAYKLKDEIGAMLFSTLRTMKTGK